MVSLTVTAGVTMDTMLNFNRLKTISSDKDVICKALRKSSSGLMEVCLTLTFMIQSQWHATSKFYLLSLYLYLAEEL